MLRTTKKIHAEKKRKTLPLNKKGEEQQQQQEATVQRTGADREAAAHPRRTHKEKRSEGRIM